MNRLRRFSLNPMVRQPNSIGGSNPIVETTAQQIAAIMPQTAAQIYAPSAVKNMDQSDPRYGGKPPQVENVYLPAPADGPPPSGIAQIFNWLLNGRLIG